MKRTAGILTLVIFCLNGLATAQAAGDRVGNGGGLAERNVLYAYSKLEQYAGFCLKTELCKLTEREERLLEKISASMPKERSFPDQIQFLSEKKHPGTFVIDGQIKAAKTGDSIGSQIFINTDLLYLKNSRGVFEALGLADSLAMLIHEFGHHHGNFSHSALDLLGIKVASQLQKRAYTTPILPQNNEISAVVINGEGGSSFPDVLLYIYDDVVDISQKFKKALKCPVFTFPIGIGVIPDISISFKSPKAASFHNVYWEKVSDNNNGGVVFRIRGNLTNYCDDSVTKIRKERDFKARIRFEIHETKTGEESQWVLTEDSVKINQVKDPWFRILYLPFLTDY